MSMSVPVISQLHRSSNGHNSLNLALLRAGKSQVAGLGPRFRGSKNKHAGAEAGNDNQAANRGFKHVKKPN